MINELILIFTLKDQIMHKSTCFCIMSNTVHFRNIRTLSKLELGNTDYHDTNST